MMLYAVLAFLWLSAPAVALAVATGLAVIEVSEPSRFHAVVGLCGGLAAVLANTLSSLYAAASSRLIIPADSHGSLRFRRKLWLSAAVGMTASFAALLTGAASHTGRWPPMAHAVAGYAALIVQGHSIARQTILHLGFASCVTRTPDSGRVGPVRSKFLS